MKILKAIGGFFARIGRWIRDTAWVQPLLIVGGIFAIIFSIPYIVDAVEANFEGGSEAVTYFQKYEKSLEGVKTHESEADKLLKYMDAMNEDATKVSADDKKLYGEKFILIFVQKECDGCDKAYDALKELQNGWTNSNSEFYSTETFKIHSIFVDSELDDDKEIYGENENAFTKYLMEDQFFTLDESYFGKTPYYTNHGDSTYKSDINSISNPGSFKTPTSFLVDFAKAKADRKQFAKYGVTDVLFDIPGKNGGSDALHRARTLFDFWHHTNDFAPIA